MKKIVDIIKDGIKLTLTPAINDKTGEKLGFIPFELNSKMTASAFLAQWKREDANAPIISVRPMNIARAAFVAADMLGIIGNGKAAYKLRSILENADIRAAVDDTDEKAATVAKIGVDIRRAEKQAERAALVGVNGAKLENERTALAAMRSDYEGAKIALAAARKFENDLCAAKVAELFPTFHNDENENK
jgi:hypothetical protein